MTANRFAANSHSRPQAHDAIALLETHHDLVAQMFADYKKTHSISKKRVLIADICAALSVQGQIDDEIFYPAVRAALKGKQPEAKAKGKLGRASLRDLIAQLEGLEPDTEGFDTKVNVLSQHFENQFNDEQSPIYSRVKSSSLDLVALGARMTARKEELQAQTVG